MLSVAGGIGGGPAGLPFVTDDSEKSTFGFDHDGLAARVLQRAPRSTW